MGELVLVWPKSVGEKKTHWHGPGHVLGVQASRIWVAHETKVYRCSPEQVKRLSPKQESLVRLLPDDLRVCRNRLRERGAGNIVELDGRERPPSEFKEGPELEGHDVVEEGAGPVAMQADGQADVSAEGVEAWKMLSWAVREAIGSNAPSQKYGPQRPVSDLTRAMRSSLRNLDSTREVVAEADEDVLLVEEVLVSGEVCVAEVKKKRKAEVSEKELEKHEEEHLSSSKASEWQKMLDTKSVKLHFGKEAEDLVNEVGKDRLLSSRFVITR